MCRSEPQIPAERIRTLTPSPLGAGTSTTSISPLTTRTARMRWRNQVRAAQSIGARTNDLRRLRVPRGPQGPPLHGLAEQRIVGGQSGKAAEVAIDGPQGFHGVRNAESGNACVVDLGSDNAPGRDERPQGRPMLRTLAEQDQARRLDPRFDLIEREGRRRARG